MKSNEILKQNAKEILEKILKGESLSIIEKEYGVSKKTITTFYRNLFAKDENSLKIFNEILESKKKKTSTIVISSEKMEQLTRNYLKGNITLSQASRILHIDKQTFKSKMLECIKNNKELLKLYEIKKSMRRDYSNFNFKQMALEMLEKRCSQREIEQKYDLKPKTMSRKIEKFNNEKDKSLYYACKTLGSAISNKRKIDNNEIKLIDNVISKYKEDDLELE